MHFPHSQDPRPEQRGAEGGEVGGLKGWCIFNSGIKKVLGSSNSKKQAIQGANDSRRGVVVIPAS